MGRTWLFFVLLLLASCSSVSTTAVSGAGSARLRAEPDRMVVIAVANPATAGGGHAGSIPRGYDEAASYAVSDRAQADLDALASRFGLEQVGAWSIVSLKLQCAVYRLAANARRDDVLDALRQDRRVRLAEPLQTFQTLGAEPASAVAAPGEPVAAAYNDPYWQLQKGFAQLDAGDAQQWTRGDGVRVAIVDTGVDRSHVDLEGRVAMARDFVDADAAQFARDRHGTEVAGIIAAVANNHQGIVGIAPHASLAVFKACWQLAPDIDAAQCNSFTLAEALAAAIDSGAQIINLSLGGPADPLLGELVEQAIGRGIIVTGAMPPGGHAEGFPTGVPGVIAVDRSDRIDANPRVLHAPGSDIVTTVPGGHYDFVSGSSFATAHVTATVALLLALSPHLGAEAIVALLQATGEPLASATQATRDGGPTSINACAAVSRVQGLAGCPSRMAARPTAGSRLPPAAGTRLQQP